MTVESTQRKRANYPEAGLRPCPKCHSEQACWHSALDLSPVSLICQRCGAVWPDTVESKRTEKAMWKREEKEKR